MIHKKNFFNQYFFFADNKNNILQLFYFEHEQKYKKTNIKNSQKYISIFFASFLAQKQSYLM